MISSSNSEEDKINKIVQYPDDYESKSSSNVDEFGEALTAPPSPFDSRPVSPLRNSKFYPEQFEEFKLDFPERNKAVGWINYYAGVIVQQVRSSIRWNLVGYKVSPFGYGGARAPELYMESKQVFQVGQWVKFARKYMFDREINELYKAIEPLLHTMPCLNKVYVECEIVVGHNKNAFIRSKLNCWQTEIEARNQCPTQLIHRAFDDLKLVTPSHCNTVCWATLEYIGEEHEGDGYWRIVHIRPTSYGSWHGH